jgi:hypothetical protein
MSLNIMAIDHRASSRPVNYNSGSMNSTYRSDHAR